MSNKIIKTQNESHLSAAHLSAERLAVITQVVCDSVQSDNTRRAYARALSEFVAWYQAAGEPELSKAVVRRYLAERRAAGMGTGAYNQALSAINKLVREAADNQAIPEQVANGIERIEGLKREGVRSGNWLTKEQAEQLIKAPDITTLAGLRDRAILALLIGTGIRRAELCSLTFAHLAQREGRWVILDMIGKRGKVRTVPVPSFAKHAIDLWAQAAGISSGLIFRRINKSDALAGESITEQAIYYLVANYSRALWGEAGIIQPHDLRRTFAKLARRGGAQLEQVSLVLGHSSLRTTQDYLGEQLDLSDAPCDRLGLHINGE